MFIDLKDSEGADISISVGTIMWCGKDPENRLLTRLTIGIATPQGPASVIIEDTVEEVVEKVRASGHGKTLIEMVEFESKTPLAVADDLIMFADKRGADEKLGIPTKVVLGVAGPRGQVAFMVEESPTELTLKLRDAGIYRRESWKHSQIAANIH